MEDDNDGDPVEESTKYMVIGLEAVLDFSSRQNALLADSTVIVATGSSGLIDFTGNPPGSYVINCPVTIEIYADSIRLNPGASVTDICGPGYVTTGMSRDILAVATLCTRTGDAYPSMPVDVEFGVLNMGNIPDTYSVTAHNSFGWPIHVSEDYISLDHIDPMDTVITVTVDVPSYAMPMLDSIWVWVNIWSTTDPGVHYSEYTCVPVYNVRELKGVTIFEYDVENGFPSDTARVFSQIINCGELDDGFDLIVSDSLGWEIIPPADNLFLESLYDTIYETRIVIPPGAAIEDINKIYLAVQSTSSPSVSSYYTVTVQVGDVTDADEPETPIYKEITTAASQTHSIQ